MRRRRRDPGPSPIDLQIFDMEKQQRYIDAIRGIAEGSRVAPR
jgi:hypothetical protein